MAPPTAPRCLFVGSAEYPSRLRALARPPAQLQLRGAFPLEWDGPCLGVVGARAASAEGCAVASRLALSLAEAGVLIVSGGALGIDAAAHRGAVAVGRPTWVMLPTDVERPVPARNRRLFGEVLAAGGALLADAELAPGKLPFLRRNRLIAACADQVLVIEARADSGTRYTALAAQALGRPVLFWRWPSTDPRSEGRRADWGQAGQEIDSLSALRRQLGLDTPDAEDDPILLVLAEGAATADQLARRLGQSPSQILGALGRLELAGRVSRHGGRYAGR